MRVEWDALQKDPEIGDVLWHSNELMVLVLRRRELLDNVEIDVLWLWIEATGENGYVTTHDGELHTWRGWMKA